MVDNASADGSQEMVTTEFPQVKLIDNRDNVGFSKANNQAIKLASQPYTLILNPDTIIEEDTLTKCIAFMEKHPEAGALGVKMVDGSGTYLPESKRGFPTPFTAFAKITGLSKLFPSSQLFNRYYLGHLSSDKTHEVDVLTGAFTMMPTSFIQEIGGFDEDYFMYGEDIELSYQVTERGHRVYYFPETQIIHFKGESTKKISSTYLKNFYGAMGIYAKKRQTASTRIWSWLLSLAIFLSAIAGLAKKISLKQLRPLLDYGLLTGIVFGLQAMWARWYFNDPEYYQASNSYKVYLGLIAVVIFCYFLFGQYDKRHNVKHLTYSFVTSFLTSLTVYSILPSYLRSSRIILVMAVLIAPFLLFLSRKLYNGFFNGTYSFNVADAKRVAVIGSTSSYEKVSPIVSRFSGEESLVGRIAIDKGVEQIGLFQDVNEIVRSRGINELLFCSKDLSTKDIFQTMAEVGSQVAFKVANSDNTSILGSNSKERVGEWYALDISFRIDEPFHKRTKLLLDIMMALMVLIGFVFVLIFSKAATKLLSNAIPVLVGRKTWIGYMQNDARLTELPRLRQHVFDLEEIVIVDVSDIHAANLWYARNFTTWMEASNLSKLFFGRFITKGE